jgi:hypothetical protein
MEKSEQGFVIKFLFFNGLSANTIDRKLFTVIGPPACSLAQTKNWSTRFTEGD